MEDIAPLAIPVLFVTFIVILVTLVFQGLTLPWVIRKVKPEDKYTAIPEPDQEVIIQKKIAEVSLRFLNQNYGRERAHNEHLQNLFAKLQSDLRSLDGVGRDARDFQETNENSLAEYEAVYLELLERQRRLLDEMNQSNDFDEELIRKYLTVIDFEEFELREKRIN